MLYLLMAQRTETQWVDFFANLAIPQEVATQYAANFVKNRVTDPVLPSLDKQTLNELGITVIGDVLAILQKVHPPQDSSSANPLGPLRTGLVTTSTSIVKPPQYNCPQLQTEMTSAQFLRFKVECDGYKPLVSLPAHGSSSPLQPSM